MSERVQVLVLDQWSASAQNLDELSFQQCWSDLGLVHRILRGGDHESAIALGISHVEKQNVSPESKPFLGTVWFRESASGGLEIWKTNYDSGD